MIFHTDDFSLPGASFAIHSFFSKTDSPLVSYEAETGQLKTAPWHQTTPPAPAMTAAYSVFYNP